MSTKRTSLDAPTFFTRSPNLIDGIGYSSSTHASHIITDLAVDQASHDDLAEPEHILPPNISHATGAMYLDMKAQLPSPSVQEELLAIFFQECNWFFGLLEPHCLRKLQTEAKAIEHNVFQTVQQMLMSWRFTALLFQTLAVALQFLPSATPCIEGLGINNHASRDVLSERYSNNASQIASIASQASTDISTVECYLLRAFWLKNAGRGKESWRALGHCVRYVAQIASCSNRLVCLLYTGRRKTLSFTWSQSLSLAEIVGMVLTILPTFGSSSTGDRFGPRYFRGTGTHVVSFVLDEKCHSHLQPPVAEPWSPTGHTPGRLYCPRSHRLRLPI